MKKIFISILMLLMIITTSMPVMAAGFDVEFYQGLEGQTIKMVDSAGNIVESQTIDAMGKAYFKSEMQESYSLEMDQNEAQDVEAMNKNVTNGIPILYVIILMGAELAVVLALTSNHYKQKVKKKYDFLMDYEYNAQLDEE